MKILLYLELRQWANYITLTLKTPKRLIPAILAVLWFSAIWMPQMLIHRHRPMPALPPGFAINATLPEVVPAIVFFALSLAMIYFIARSFSDSLVVFGMPDIDYLFATPLSKRAIMTLKLLGIYAKVGAYGLFLTFIMAPQVWVFVRPERASIAGAWLGAVLFAALVINICTIINLISTFRDGKKWWLAWVVRGMAYGLVLVVAGSVAYIGLQTGDYSQAALHTLTNPVVMMLLLPAKWTADLLLNVFTGWTPKLWVELGMMGLLAGASYIMVMLRDENPYEPSLSASTRSATIRAAVRAGGYGKMRAEIWKKKAKSTNLHSGVTPFGRGATALIWKNLNIAVRTSGKVLVAIPIIIAVALIASRVASPVRFNTATIEAVAAGVLSYIIFISSGIMLQSFRADLKQANLIKPMPIPSWQIIAVQAVQGTLMVTCLAWTMVILVGATYGLSHNSVLVLAALALPFITYDLLCWQSAAAVIYPKWEDPTQQYVGMMISGLAGMMAIGPPVVVGAVLWFLHLGMVVTVMAAACISAGMAVGGIMLSGYLYSRFDPTDE